MSQPLDELPKKSSFSFPTAHTVLLIIAALVALSTWLIPAGKYDKLEYKAATDNTPALFIHHAHHHFFLFSVLFFHLRS